MHEGRFSRKLLKVEQFSIGSLLTSQWQNCDWWSESEWKIGVIELDYKGWHNCHSMQAMLGIVKQKWNWKWKLRSKIKVTSESRNEWKRGIIEYDFKGWPTATGQKYENVENEENWNFVIFLLLLLLGHILQIWFWTDFVFLAFFLNSVNFFLVRISFLLFLYTLSNG